ARDAGLRVSPQDVRDTLERIPAFQVNHHFDFDTYRATLQRNNLTPEQFEERTREDLLVRAYQRVVVAGTVVDQAAVDQRYRIANEMVQVDYVYVDPARYAQAVKEDPAVEQAYYKQHQQDYLQPTQYRIAYFVLGISQLGQQGEKLPARAVERYYQMNLETLYTTPRKVRASHILLRVDPAMKPEQVDAKRQELQKVLQMARSGADFAALAKKYSQDKSAVAGGDLGFFAKNEVPPAFAEAAFALKVGQVSDIVRTPFGLDIIKVTAEQPQVVRTLAQVRPEIEGKLLEERAERRLDLELDRLPGDIQQKGIQAAAKEFNASVQQSDWIDGTRSLEGLGATQALYERMRGDKVNAAGVLRRNPVQGHIFFQVTAVKDAFVRPFEQVQPLVRAKVAAQQEAAAALADAQARAKALHSTADLARFAKAQGLTVRTAAVTAVDPTVPQLGINPDFVHTAFRLAPQSPIGVSVQDGKAYLLAFRSRSIANPEQAAAKKAQIADAEEQSLRNYFLQANMAALRKETPVKVLIPELLQSP
ncbi:MAG TPA: peptidylprolyl isomerase, partial [bacterium]|nr:peptidylprolyl isomerase [bacterium]